MNTSFQIILILALCLAALVLGFFGAAALGRVEWLNIITGYISTAWVALLVLAALAVFLILAGRRIASFFSRES